MQILTHARQFLTAAALVACGSAASATSVMPEGLSTLASFDVDGAYAYSSSHYGTKLSLGGTFSGDATALAATDLGATADYWLGASFTLDGHEVLSGTVPLLQTSVTEIVTDTMLLLAHLDGTLGGLLSDVLDDGHAWLGPIAVEAALSDVVKTDTTIDGAFSVMAKAYFLDLSKIFCLPFSGEGTFDIALKLWGHPGDTDPSPVPLPAGAPLLLLALGGMAGLRRLRAA